MLCVGTYPGTLRAPQTQSVWGCMPTQSVGTIKTIERYSRASGMVSSSPRA